MRWSVFSECVISASAAVEASDFWLVVVGLLELNIVSDLSISLDLGSY